MYIILKNKYTLSIKFVPAQVRGKNRWSTSQVRLQISNYRTLPKYWYHHICRHYTTIVLYYYCTILLLYYTTIVLYYYCTILLLYYTTIVLYYYCTILLLFHIILTLQRTMKNSLSRAGFELAVFQTASLPIELSSQQGLAVTR
jgi:hypothetical protein